MSYVGSPSSNHWVAWRRLADAAKEKPTPSGRVLPDIKSEPGVSQMIKL